MNSGARESHNLQLIAKHYNYNTALRLYDSLDTSSSKPDYDADILRYNLCAVSCDDANSRSCTRVEKDGITASVKNYTNIVPYLC